MLSFFAIQGSDPGYITKDMVSHIMVQEDEEGLLLESSSNTNAESQANANTAATTTNTIEMSERGGNHSQAATRQRTSRVKSPLEESENGDSSPEKALPSLLDTPPTATALFDVEQHTSGNDNGNERTHVRKYCHACGFYPPIRSHHCRRCNCCVATFDHHCNFIGTCIGERNQCRFYWFLSFQLLGFLSCHRIVSSSLLHLRFDYFDNDVDSHPSSFLSSKAFWTQQAWWVVVAKVYLKPLMFCAFLMWLFQTCFALLNATQFECGAGSRHIDYLRDFRSCDCPFNQVRTVSYCTDNKQDKTKSVDDADCVKWQTFLFICLLTAPFFLLAAPFKSYCVLL
jgi:hypothetical protein